MDTLENFSEMCQASTADHHWTYNWLKSGRSNRLSGPVLSLDSPHMNGFHHKMSDH